MNVLNKAVLQTLKKNRTRTIVTIIGIMLSTALICAVTTSLVSFVDFGKKGMLYMNGDWHARLDGDEDAVEIVRNSPKVDEYSVSYSPHVANYKRADKDRVEKWFILPVTENYYDMLALRLTRGRLPRNSREIMLGDAFLHLRPELDIGSEVTLKLGEYDINGSSGEKEFTIHEERTYTIVGVCDESSRNYAVAFTSYDPDDILPDSDTGNCDIFVRMKEPADIYDFMSDHHFRGDTNDELLIFYGASLNAGLFAFILSIISIIIILVALGAISLIDNAFSISISERTKQFGLLSSIGATKKQLRRMVYFEALVISVIAIPLGILLGLAGMAVVFGFLGTKFGSLMDVPFGVSLEISPAAILAAVGITLVIIFLSALAPAQRATKMSAVEAIRQTNDIQNSKKLRRTPRLTAKFFGLPGVLATKHFRCNKKRYRTTIFSLFLSIVLFISASAFTMYLVEAAEQEYDSNGCDIVFECDPEAGSGRTADEMYDAVKKTRGVTDAAYAYCMSYKISYDSKYLSEDALEKYGTDENGRSSIDTLIVCVNDSEYRKLLEQYDLSESEYMDISSPLAIAADCTRYYDCIEEKNISMDVFDTDTADGSITYIKPDESGHIGNEIAGGIVRYDTEDGGYKDVPLSEAQAGINFNIGKTISGTPYYAYSGGSVPVVLIYPYSYAKEYLPERKFYPMLSYFVLSSDHKASADALEEMLMNSGDSYYEIEDHAAEIEAVRNIVLIVKVFSFGFIILISLIAAANVFNTITTNVNLRRREFAMLRSVGMSSKGINRMMNFECLMYGAKSLLYGLPFSFAVTYLIYKVECADFDIGFHFPVWAVATAVFSVFAVVFSAMLYSMSKIRKDNPIDALKNENV